MVFLSTSEEWQQQSSLLLQARPTTTRITTKYNIPNIESAKYKQGKNGGRDHESVERDAVATPKIPRAVLTLKTYDPESGVCLKFKTDRAADVGRLIGGLNRLGRHMAALPGKIEDTAMEEPPPPEEGSTQEPAHIAVTANASKEQHPAGSGGGKRKKKGKK